MKQVIVTFNFDPETEIVSDVKCVVDGVEKKKKTTKKIKEVIEMDQQYFNQPQYPQQQGQYSQQPASGYAGGGYQGNTSVMSVKDWIITYLLMCIPFANFVFLFIFR